MASTQPIEPPIFAAKHWKVFNFHQYYNTDSNFDNGSPDKISLNPGNKLSFHHNLTKIEYGLNKKLNLQFGARFAAVSTVTSDFKRSNGNFSDLLFSADYLWVQKKYSLIPGLEINMPLFKVAANTDDALLNEGAWEFKAKFLADRPLTWFTVYGQAALSMLTDGRGGRAYLNAGVKKVFGNSRILFEMEGMNTIIDDKFADQAAPRTNVVNTVQGGSLAFYSVNPAWIKLSAQYAHKIFKTAAVGIGAGTDLSGSRTSAGTSITGFFRYEFSGKNEKISQDFEAETNSKEMKYFDYDPSKPKKKVKKIKKRKSKETDDSF